MTSKGGSASRRSLLVLDAMYFILANVRGGLGPFLAVYLTSVHRWDPSQIGEEDLRVSEIQNGVSGEGP